MKKNEKTGFYAVVVVAIAAIVALVFISTTQKTEQTVLLSEVSTETLEPIALIEESVEEEQNIGGMTIKLDECLQDCQYKICKKNCVKE